MDYLRRAQRTDGTTFGTTRAYPIEARRITRMVPVRTLPMDLYRRDELGGDRADGTRQRRPSQSIFDDYGFSGLLPLTRAPSNIAYRHQVDADRPADGDAYRLLHVGIRHRGDSTGVMSAAAVTLGSDPALRRWASYGNVFFTRCSAERGHQDDQQAQKKSRDARRARARQRAARGAGSSGRRISAPRSR